jgi:molybdenum cofactor cytidylyltransferase
MPEPDCRAPTPDIVALVLAAGKGSRFDASGARYKPVQPLADGTPMVYAVCHTLLQHADAVTVICGPQQQAVRDALGGLPVNLIHCTDADMGMSASLRCGINHSPARIGWLIALADMPCIQTNTVRAVATRLRQDGHIVRPQFQNRPGHPVAFASQFRDELLQLTGDEGARAIIRRHPDALTLIPVNDPGCLLDIDTQEQLQQLGKTGGQLAPQ